MMMGSPVCVMKQLMLIFSSKLKAAIFLQRIIILLFLLFLDVFCPKTLLPALTMFTPATTDWLYLTLINMRTLTQGDYKLFHWLRNKKDEESKILLPVKDFNKKVKLSLCFSLSCPEGGLDSKVEIILAAAILSLIVLLFTWWVWNIITRHLIIMLMILHLHIRPYLHHKVQIFLGWWHHGERKKRIFTVR